MNSNKIDTGLLKDSIPITDVVNRLGLKLNRQLHGDCPTGHESKSHTCFRVNEKNNYCYCFHCNKSWDIIEITRLMLNKDFLQSVDWLKESFGYGNGKKIIQPTIKQKEITQELIAKDALYELVYNFGKELLYKDEGREALNYLTLVRQYDYDSLKKTDWIYFPKDAVIHKHLLTICPESAQQISKLSLQGAYRDKFVLAFPYRNRDGLITGFVKRAIKQEGIEINGNMVRYDSTTGLSKYDLFNLNNCKGQEQIIIVEGYPEGLYFPTQGITNITAIGAGMLSKTHIVGIKELGIKSVILCLDNDEAGIGNTQEALKLLSDNAIKAVAIEHDKLMPYKDPDELVKAKGVDAFVSLINEMTKLPDLPKHEEAIELKTFANSDYGNAERLVYYHGDNIRYVWDINQWYFWNGKYWQVDNCGHIQRLAKDTARKIHKELDLFSSLDDKKFKEKQKAVFSHQLNSESSIKQKAMIESARSEIEIAIETNQLDTNKWLLNCNNGVIDLKTGELLDHDKKYLITKMAPVDYDPKSKLDMWNSFLKMVTNGNENIESFLQYAVGYSLTGNTSEEKLFFVYGPSATGKSTFIETIRTIFGDYAKTADFETFLSRSFTGGIRNDIAELAGARLVSSIEVDEGKKLAEGLVKTITGGDTIRARFLYQEAFQFLPQFKLWLVANHQPKVNAYDTAMWRRILVVPFEHVIPEEDRDPEVKTTLKNPEISGSAILAWAVQGCLRWQEYGLQIPREIKEASETYRQEMDVISDFIEEKCVVKVDLITTKQALYFQYKEWCVKAGIIPETKTTFGKMLKENNDIKDDSGAGNVSIWRGVGLKSMTNTQLAESQNS
jgi:putative DNA primase/helicase